MKPFNQGILAAVALAALAIVTLSSSWAADFPSSPVRIVVPYAPGGPSDIGTRLMAKVLSRHMGQTVYVENKPGAGGLIETEAYVKAEPDGYTLLTGSIGPFAIIPAFKVVRYDVAKDFVPLALVWNSSQVLVVHRKLGVNSLAEFIAHAKANPGKTTVGSAGVGSITHMSLELFKLEARVDLVHVPYRSIGALMPDLLGGQIDAAFAEVTVINQFVKSGSLQALTITSPERSPLLPGVPTTAESGLPQVDTQNWFGIVASPKIPADRLAVIKKAVDATLADPEYLASVQNQGLVPAHWDGESFRKLIEVQAIKWKPIVKAANIQF